MNFLSKEFDSKELAGLPIDDPRRRRLPPLLRKAWLKLNAIFLHHVSGLGLTPDKYIVLRWLQEKGSAGLTQRELSDYMASDPNTIASLLNRMEKAGWIRRSPRDEDRRTKNVSATKSGRQIFEKARSLALALEKKALSVLSEEERALFLDSLEKIAASCARSYEAALED